MAAKRTTKGMAGTRTGGGVRKKIRSLSKCMTAEQIGNKLGRSASTIGQIKSGAIKNPPSTLAKKIRSIPSCKKKK